MPKGRGSRRARQKPSGSRKRRRVARGGYRRRDYERVLEQISAYQKERGLKFKPEAVELIYRNSLRQKVEKAIASVAKLPDPFERGPAE